MLYIKTIDIPDNQIILGCHSMPDQDIFFNLIKETFEKEFTIQETNVGADRWQVRMTWQHAHWVLNFDEYSDSLWIEAADPQSAQKFPLLIEKLANYFPATY